MNSSDRFYRNLITLLGGAAVGTAGVAGAQDATPPPAPTEDVQPTEASIELADVVDGYGIQAAHQHIEGCETGDCAIQGFPAGLAALEAATATTAPEASIMSEAMARHLSYMRANVVGTGALYFAGSFDFVDDAGRYLGGIDVYNLTGVEFGAGQDDREFNFEHGGEVSEYSGDQHNDQDFRFIQLNNLANMIQGFSRNLMDNDTFLDGVDVNYQHRGEGTIDRNLALIFRTDLVTPEGLAEHTEAPTASTNPMAGQFFVEIMYPTGVMGTNGLPIAHITGGEHMTAEFDGTEYGHLRPFVPCPNAGLDGAAPPGGVLVIHSWYGGPQAHTVQPAPTPEPCPDCPEPEAPEPCPEQVAPEPCPECPEPTTPEAPEPQIIYVPITGPVQEVEIPDCRDGHDNDGDGLTDYGTGATADPGCLSPGDTSEFNPTLQETEEEETTPPPIPVPTPVGPQGAVSLGPLYAALFPTYGGSPVHMGGAVFRLQLPNGGTLSLAGAGNGSIDDSVTTHEEGVVPGSEATFPGNHPANTTGQDVALQGYTSLDHTEGTDYAGMLRFTAGYTWQLGGEDSDHRLSLEAGILVAFAQLMNETQVLEDQTLIAVGMSPFAPAENCQAYVDAIGVQGFTCQEGEEVSESGNQMSIGVGVPVVFTYSPTNWLSMSVEGGPIFGVSGPGHGSVGGYAGASVLLRIPYTSRQDSDAE